jgi:short-subunit dehydrogenase
MKKILIVGATSMIAQHAARIWATRGDQLFLVARNSELLGTIQKDLEIRGGSSQTYCLDMNHFHDQKTMWNAAAATLGTIDVVLIAHGSLPDQSACENSVEATIEAIKTNAFSTIAFLTEIAPYFEKRGHGVIAVISSVAGDRGRQSNYVYGSAKSMVSTFCSGLRQRLFKSGVSVITIKPGFVDTPMTRDFKKGILWASPQKVARDIVGACDSPTRSILYTPRFWGLIMLVIQHIPEIIFRKIKL